MSTKTVKKSANKAPQINLAAYNRDPEEKQIQEKHVAELHLDPKNPRLAEVVHTGTQASIQKVMEKEFDLQPIKDSLYRNAFFYEEPLVAIYEPLAEFGHKPVLVVVEGNRRLADGNRSRTVPTGCRRFVETKFAAAGASTSCDARVGEYS